MTMKFGTDEIKQYLDACYESSYEAFGTFISFSCRSTPPIIHLQVHLPDQQPIIFEEDEDGNIQDLVDTNPDHDITLTAWFKANAELADNCNLLYQDFPSKMVWNKKTYKWTTRKKGVSAIGRMYHTHPTSGEWFYLGERA